MNLAVYRLQLFKPTEGFIAQQAASLPNADPLLVGRKLFGEAVSTIPHWTPNDLHGWSLAAFLATANPAPFVNRIRQHGSRLVHAHFSVDGLYALPLTQKLDCPLITTIHGFDVTTSRGHFFRSGRPALMRYAVLQDDLKRHGTHFICVSRFMYEAALRAGFPEKRMSVHYIGIETSEFMEVNRPLSPRIMHIARLVEKKGTRYLIDAVAKIRRKFPDVMLEIVGDGPLRGILEAQVKALAIEAHVRFHGVRPHGEIRSMLSGASALVLPSITAASGDAEGLGLVLLEASAAGVPVIGTRHGGIPEAVVDGDTGLLVPERDSKSLAEAMDILLSSSTLQLKLGRAAREHVFENFDISRQSAKLESLYRRLC